LTSLETELANTKTERDTLKAKVAGMEQAQAAAQKAEADALLADALKAGRIDANGKAAFELLFKQDYNSAKTALSSLPERRSLASLAQSGGTGGGASGKYDRPWRELDKLGLLPGLKTENPELFRLKFQEEFGTEPEK
jgi:hypothetical protein